MTLEIIVGNLRDGYNQLQPGTMLHADQLMAEQVKDANLRNQAFYVADGPLYSLEGQKKTPTLWLTREPHNLVLRHLNDEVNSSYEQLVNTGNYRPNPEEARKAMKAKDTLRIDLTRLHLQGDDTQWRYLEISTTKYNKLKPEERKLAERFYGQGKAFVAAMSVLKEGGIDSTKVYVVNPGYVQKEATNGPVGRAAWRYDFDSNAGSLAGNRGVSNPDGVRGVRRESVGEMPTGRALEKSSAAAMFEQVLKYSAPFVPDVARAQYNTGLRKLLKA